MKKYMVKVNGINYEVEIQEITSNASAPVVQQNITTAPVIEAPKATVQNNSVVDGDAVKAPLPGNILSISVSAGQSVKSGDILMILEAMKMENEILAQRDGVVASVVVSQGATVGTGDVLVTLK